MPTEKYQKVKKFLKENVNFLENTSGGGEMVNLPDYEIHPREFLEYAEAELSDLKSNKSIVNCISNLKRAVDSQIDIFFYALNILSIYKKRKLGIDKKLGFIEKCGIFSKYSLSRINTIRNKLEHQYKVPKIEDIYVYFDLVSAFITVLEVRLDVAGNNCEIEFDINEISNDDEQSVITIGELTTKYDPKKCTHIIHWKKKKQSQTYSADSSNLDELASFINFHVLLLNISNTMHGQYANSQIEKL